MIKNKLFLIKLTHTIIWAIYLVIIIFIFYAGLFDRIGLPVWTAVGLMILEGVVLILNKCKCPLTVLGHRYTSNPETGFDIFLPKWLAKYNKIIFGCLFFIGLIIVIYRIWN